MPKADWRGPFYAGEETPTLFLRRGNIGTTLEGAGSYNLTVSGNDWRYISWWGYTYDGPSSGLFPLQDGSISGALRNDNASFGRFGSMPYGFIMRMQNLPSLDPTAPTPLANMAMYMAGLSYRTGMTFLPSETSDNPECAIYRMIAGFPTLLGSVFFPRVILDTADSRYLQIEFRIQNDGPNVLIEARWNEGTEASEPGTTPDWTAWTLIATDTAPGVLINGGYWGFGGQILFPSGFATGGAENTNRVYIDQVRILTEIL